MDFGYITKFNQNYYQCSKQLFKTSVLFGGVKFRQILQVKMKYSHFSWKPLPNFGEWIERISTHLDSDFNLIEFFKLVFKLFIQCFKHVSSSNAKSSWMVDNNPTSENWKKYYCFKSFSQHHFFFYLFKILLCIGGGLT